MCQIHINLKENPIRSRATSTEEEAEPASQPTSRQPLGHDFITKTI